MDFVHSFAVENGYNLFNAPTLTRAHKWLGMAAILGFLYVVGHLVTIIVTCAENGFGWGLNAWMFDITGFLAGAAFAFICKSCSNMKSSECRQNLFWIIVWSGMTLGVRVLDVMMLFGILKIEAIYHTPHGATLAANVISEILIAIPYNALAFAGSMTLFSCPKDVGLQDREA